MRYRDEEEMREMYEEERMSMEEISDECGVTEETIRRWIHRHGIESRGRGRPSSNHATYTVGKGDSPYPKWSAKGAHLCVHRLSAIADGADPYKVFSNGDYHVHHINGIKWDNRPENLMLLDDKMHSAVTALQRLSPEDMEEAIEIIRMGQFQE